MTHLDTHVVVWLYAGLIERFPQTIVDVLEREDLVVSPMALLELEYLFETDRITVDGRTVLDELRGQIGLNLSPTPFRNVVEQATKQSWTRDPFDRLIVGHAAADGAYLVTKDRRIREHYAGAVWDD